MSRLVDSCGLCGSHALEPVLSLGSSPATCSMVPVGERLADTPHHPLELLRCEECSLVQLSVVVDPVDTFPPNYPYQSGNSLALHRDFEDLAAQVPVGRNHLVVDIGANDGTLLRKFDCRTVGVEPTDQADKIDGPAYRAFFNEAVARRIVDEHGKARVVTACNVLAHVADIGEVMRGINVLLDKGGTLVAENHDLASVVDGGQWDTVYHEHLRFYDPYSFNRLLEKHGFGAQRCDRIGTHGGSFRVFATRGAKLLAPERRPYDFERLQWFATNSRREIRDCALDPLWGIGATARATTIINYCGLDVEDIECVCEVPGSDKIGRYVPGTRIPVVDERGLFENAPDRVMLFSWHLADVIVPRLRDRGYGGDVILPLPELVAA